MLELTPEEAVATPGPWTHRDITANGARFHAVTMGEGPLVVLLHGFPAFWWTWRDLLPRLAELGYRAVAVDLRGYAGSDHPPRGYDLFTNARDVSGIIQSLGERSATVIGHDMGGWLGWATASLQPDVVNKLAVISAPHPVRMRKLLISDRAQMAAASWIFNYQRPWFPERNLIADDAQEIEEFLQTWSSDTAWLDPQTVLMYRAAFLTSNTAHCALEYYRWAMRSIPRGDGRRFVSAMNENKVSVPVLQIHGSDDRTILPRTAAGSDEWTVGPYAWRSFLNVGHFPQEEEPEGIADMLCEWLKAEDSDPNWNDFRKH